ncbi:MAG: hypothetical protein PQJ46_13210 [Spirochaetales bacterium]|nr:hypothetical protein [Spirochaetales bacterium]
MNTIPTTTDKVDYTVVGGRKEPSLRKNPPLMSIVLLNRAGRVFKVETLNILGKLNVHEIISIEGGGPGYDVEALSMRFPDVKFIKIHNKITEGGKINIGMAEAESRFVFVIYDDMTISAGGFSEKLLEQIVSGSSLCSVPLINSRKQTVVPTIMSPAFMKNSLKIVKLPPTHDSMESLFPFDFCGIYDKDLFVKLGGFDERITTKWWQKMDFGFRAHMWGEHIQCRNLLRVKYLDDIPEESITPDESYRFFFLKNLMVRFEGDQGCLPRGRFSSYYFKSGEGFFQARKEFLEAKAWIEEHKYRFRMDARSITEIWEAP